MEWGKTKMQSIKVFNHARLFYISKKKRHVSLIFKNYITKKTLQSADNGLMLNTRINLAIPLTFTADLLPPTQVYCILYML